MKTLALLVVLARAAAAAPLADIVADRVANELPAELGVASVQIDGGAREIDPDKLAIDVPRELRAGRHAVKVIVARRASWATVVVAPLVDVAVATRELAIGDTLSPDDFAIDRRAAIGGGSPAAAQLAGATVARAIAAGAQIDRRDVRLAPAVPRGTRVTIEIVHGGVIVRGSGVLELAARPGDVATARIQFNKTTVRGTFVAPATVVVGEDR